MPKIAFVFPGQGSQHAGMGKDLLTDPEISELCADCSKAAGVDLRHLLTSADDETLKLTQNAQPALCFVGLALTLLLAVMATLWLTPNLVYTSTLICESQVGYRIRHDRAPVKEGKPP